MICSLYNWRLSLFLEPRFCGDGGGGGIDGSRAGKNRDSGSLVVVALVVVVVSVAVHFVASCYLRQHKQLNFHLRQPKGNSTTTKFAPIEWENSSIRQQSNSKRRRKVDHRQQSSPILLLPLLSSLNWRRLAVIIILPA